VPMMMMMMMNMFIVIILYMFRAQSCSKHVEDYNNKCIV